MGLFSLKVNYTTAYFTLNCKGPKPIWESTGVFICNYGLVISSAMNILNYSTDMDLLMYIFDQGTANFTTVNSQGYMYVSSGGTAKSTTVNSLGVILVSSDGTVNSITVNAGGLIYILSGGTALNIKSRYGCLICEGDDLTIVTYIIPTLRITSNTNVSSNIGSYIIISPGGTLNLLDLGNGHDILIYPYGCLNISSGGIVNSITVNYRRIYVCFLRRYCIRCSSIRER